MLVEVASGHEIGARQRGIDLELLAGRPDQLREGGERRVAPVVLVRGDNRLRRAGSCRQFGLREAAAAANDTDQLSRRHGGKYIALSM